MCRTLTSLLGAVDPEEVVVPPQDAVGVPEAHGGGDGRAVDEGARALQRLHAQRAALHHQQAVLRLDAQPRQLDVRRAVGAHQGPLLSVLQYWLTSSLLFYIIYLQVQHLE